MSISQSPPSTRGEASCLHSRSPCVLHTQTTQRQSMVAGGTKGGSSCPDGLWKLHVNSSHEVLFLLSDLVYTSFGLGSFFFFLKQLKLVFAYITPPHDYILTFLVTSSAVFICGNSACFGLILPGIGRQWSHHWSPPTCFLKVHVIQYVWKGRCLKCGFPPCSHFPQVYYLGPKSLGPSLLYQRAAWAMPGPWNNLWADTLRDD